MRIFPKFTSEHMLHDNFTLSSDPAPKANAEITREPRPSKVPGAKFTTAAASGVLAVALAAGVVTFFAAKAAIGDNSTPAKKYNGPTNHPTSNFYVCQEEEIEDKKGFCLTSEIESEYGCLQFYENERLMEWHEALQFCKTKFEEGDRKGWLAETVTQKMNDDITYSPRIDQSKWVVKYENFIKPLYWLGGELIEPNDPDWEIFKTKDGCKDYWDHRKTGKENWRMGMAAWYAKNRHTYVWNGGSPSGKRCFDSKNQLWMSGEPNFPYEPCMELFPGRMWNNRNCDSQNYALCQFTKRKVLTSEEKIFSSHVFAEESSETGKKTWKCQVFSTITKMKLTITCTNCDGISKTTKTETTGQRYNDTHVKIEASLELNDGDWGGCGCVGEVCGANFTLQPKIMLNTTCKRTEVMQNIQISLEAEVSNKTTEATTAEKSNPFVKAELEFPDDEDNDGNPDATDDDDDGNGIPDNEEGDSDGDGVIDFYDDFHNPEGSPSMTKEEFAATKDTDGDGIKDDVDPDKDGDGVPNEKEDCDGDGIPDHKDIDNNNDGIPDYMKADSNNNGIDDVEEMTTDENGDIDGDGVKNKDEKMFKLIDKNSDYDGDDLENSEDMDVNGNNILDHLEADTNKDGVPDHR